MSLTPRSTSGAAKSHPIAQSYALTILAALVVLVILHRTFGSVSFEGGLK